MNTVPLPPKEKTDTQRLEEASLEEESPKLAIAKSELEEEDEAGSDMRREERFLWALGCLILFDLFAFSQFETWSGPIVVGLLELIFVMVLARKMGVEEIGSMLAKFIESGGGQKRS